MKRATTYLRNDQFIKKLGAKVRALRQKKSLTIKQLAADSGMEYIQLSRIERGLINTSVSHIYIIAKTLGIKTKDLFDVD